ncbi:DUF2989 domain-containing protein [Vibrio sp. TH_r3]|uniref:DUF2989 domain-containing protein n=1 Tax=Vibrio sp. TH_r3 TaxID=3082084 RepID=UPI002952AB13|nr:DUF2989 domain-containing protein [Vibrio sp. TH_r3]MDV7103146.1 DUF2989 domain-containing protein [Vibrio sp. TH_r3]
MNIKIIIILLSSNLLLLGCFDNRMNTNELCASNPALRCDQLNLDDGQCRVIRTNLIWHRKDTLESPTDNNIIKEFNLVSDYHQCLELAAQIEPSKAGNKKEQRFKALLHSIDEEKRLLNELSTHDSPEALYFLWTQGQGSAMRKFLSLEGSKALETAEMQYALATYYISRDLDKTLVLLNHALELSKEATLNIDILEGLASVNHKLQQKQRAYVWVLVSKEFGVATTSETRLNVLYDFSEQQKAQFEKTAEQIIKAIKNDSYNDSLISKISK